MAESINLFFLSTDILAEIDAEYYQKYKEIMVKEKKYKFSSFYAKTVTWILVRESFGNLKSELRSIQDFRGLYEDYMEASLTEKWQKGLEKYLEDMYGVIEPI